MHIRRLLFGQLTAPAIVALVVAVAGGAYWYTHQSCTIGVAGSAAALTIEGADASSGCQQMIRDGQGRLYLADKPPSETVLCRYDYHGHTFTVRDQGTFNLVGSQMCTSLANGQGVTPTGF